MLTDDEITELKRVLETEYCSTEEAAQSLRVSRGRVNQFCMGGRIQGAFKIRDTWFIPINSIELVVRKPQGNFTNHKRGSKLKREVDDWLTRAGYATGGSAPVSTEGDNEKGAVQA